VTFRVPPDVLAEVNRIATSTGNTPTHVLVTLVKEALKARSEKPKGKQATTAPRTRNELAQR
jgi:hypothetical protein